MNNHDKHTLSVKGHASLSADPDQAELLAQFSFVGETLAEVQRDAAALIAELRNSMREQRLDMRRLKLTSIEAYLTEDAGDACCNCSVRMSGPLQQSWLDRICEALRHTLSEFSKPVISNFQLRFSLEEPQQLQQRVVIKAIADARRTADAMARAADVRIGGIANVRYAENGNLDEALDCVTVPLSLDAGMNLDSIGNIQVRFSDNVELAWSLPID